MVMAAGVSNLGLDSVGMLLSISKWSPVGVLGRRGSSRAVVGLGAVGRGESCVGPSNGGDRLKIGVGSVHRWRRRSELLHGFSFRATAADESEQEEEVEEKTDTKGVASSSPLQKDHEFSSKEMPKSSRIEQQQQRKSGQKLPGTQTRANSILSNIVDEWTSFTSVREKGDVRDVVLMSLSFAVLIYISQHLVHAYCALRHMYFNHY